MGVRLTVARGVGWGGGGCRVADNKQQSTLLPGTSTPPRSTYRQIGIYRHIDGQCRGALNMYQPPLLPGTSTPPQGTARRSLPRSAPACSCAGASFAPRRRTRGTAGGTGLRRCSMGSPKSPPPRGPGEKGGQAVRYEEERGERGGSGLARRRIMG